MKTNVLLIILILMSFLGACQNDGHKSIPVGANNDTVKGPNDSGGGDTCNGKMIESYKVDIEQLEEFQVYLKPLLDKLSIAANNNDSDNRDKDADTDKDKSKSNNPFLFLPKLKNWYIIDCKLQDIPKERKGLYLETYQTAIHTGREIFIDAKSYNSMVIEEKAKLLLHEIVMAYYLTKFLTIEELCKFSGTCSKDINIVSKWKIYRPETYRSLNEEDHQKIRSMTAWLFENRTEFSFENYLENLRRHDFDKRFLQSNYNQKQEEIEIDVQTFIRLIKKHQWSGSFPKFCHFNSDNISQSTCKVQAHIEISDELYLGKYPVKYLHIKLSIVRKSDGKTLEKVFLYPLANPEKKIKLYMSRWNSFVKVVPIALTANWPSYLDKEPTEGMNSSMLMIFMNFTDKENPEILQMFYQTLTWYSFDEEIVEKDGSKIKETYGYSSVLEDETEILFTENELPFHIMPRHESKTLIHSQQIPK